MAFRSALVTPKEQRCTQGVAKGQLILLVIQKRFEGDGQREKSIRLVDATAGRSEATKRLGPDAGVARVDRPDLADCHADARPFDYVFGVSCGC